MKILSLLKIKYEVNSIFMVINNIIFLFMVIIIKKFIYEIINNQKYENLFINYKKN